MKFKLISIIMAATALLTVPKAKADWEYQSFLNPNVASLCVSNDLAATGYGYTNILSVAAIGGIGRGTNGPGVMWTNKSTLSTIASNVPGTQIIISNGVYYQFSYLGSNNGAFGFTNSVDWSKYNLLQDVTLWTDKPGSAMPLLPTLGSGPTNLLSYCSLFFSLVGGSGANSAVTFRFLPIFDGTNQTTAAGDMIPVSVTANTTTVVNLATNVLGYKVIGAKKLRLIDIVNADADASSSVQVLKIGLVGYRP